MKTAMQELLEIINNNLKNEYTSQEFARLTIFKASAERLLEKEKEQIIQAVDDNGFYNASGIVYYEEKYKK